MSRLESSVDLDGNIYETRCNLAVTYINLNECKKAYEQIEAAEKLTKDEAALHYLKGSAAYCLADLIYHEKNEHGDVVDIKYADSEQNFLKAKEYLSLMQAANDNYSKYLELAPNTEQTQEIVNRINNNKEAMEAHKVKYGLI